MPDVFLYQGQASPSDVNLRDPTFVAIDATTSGATLVVTASVIVGIATGDALTAGATVTATVSLIVGTAAGAASAAGDLLSVSDSEIAGTESGDASASGATVLVAATIIDGTARGVVVVDQSNVGSRGRHASTFRFNRRSIDGLADGAALEARVTLIAGQASGAGAAQGKALTRSMFVRFRAGKATGDAETGGIIRRTHVTLEPGVVIDNWVAYDNDFLLAA